MNLGTLKRTQVLELTKASSVEREHPAQVIEVSQRHVRKATTKGTGTVGQTRTPGTVTPFMQVIKAWDRSTVDIKGKIGQG